jgi:hypothetical protein
MTRNAVWRQASSLPGTTQQADKLEACRHDGSHRKRRRRGAATLDYVLVLCVVLPLIAFILRVAPRMMNLVYEMTSVLVSWPFM